MMKTLLHFISFGILTAPLLPAGIIHVDASAGGSNDGSSWANAHTDLQSALAAAAAGDELWVAKGTYKPTAGTDRAVSFLMEESVALYGGFDGDETVREERDSGILTNATILSGELGDPADRTDNTHHIITGSRAGVLLDRTAVLDGFTITAAYTSDETPEHLNWGGGFRSTTANPSGATIRNCHFTDNDSTGRGAGASVLGGSPLFENCHFTENRALTGACLIIWGSGAQPEIRSCEFTDNDGSAAAGGIMIVYGSPTISDSLFRGNTGGFGGAIYSFNCNPVFTRCEFIGNTGVRGGAFNTQQPGTSHFISCLISGNHATNHGGAVFCNVRSTPKFTNVTISGNRSSTEGGAIYSDDADTIASFENCLIWNNQTASTTTTEAASFVEADGGVVNFDSCIVENSVGSDPLFNTPFDPATAPGTGGDFRLPENSPAVDAGDGSFNMEATDLGGDPRVLNTIDLGAFEYQSLEALWLTDFDNDGLAYGLEQAIGTDPKIGDAGNSFAPQLTGVGEISFGINAAASPDTVWTIRRSTDLGNFTETIYGPSSTPPNSPFNDPNPAAARAFYRVEVEFDQD